MKGGARSAPTGRPYLKPGARAPGDHRPYRASAAGTPPTAARGGRSSGRGSALRPTNPIKRVTMQSSTLEQRDHVLWQRSVEVVGYHELTGAQPKGP